MPKVVSVRQRIANRQNARRPRRKTTRSLFKLHPTKLTPIKPKLKNRRASASSQSTLKKRQSKIPTDSTLKNLLAHYQPRNQIERTLVERIALCSERLNRSRRFETDAVRDAYLDLGEIDKLITGLRRQLVSDEESLQNARRLSQLLNTPEDQLTPDERDSRSLLYDQFALKHKAYLFGPEHKNILATVIDMLPRVIGSSAKSATSLQNELTELETQRTEILQSRSEANLLPNHYALKDLVRYESMLDRHLHRAIAQLRELRKVRRNIKPRRRPFKESKKVPHNDTT